ncbi:MAG TPA: winged helix-turn-helix domain-containing protein [Bryobacteraceae bacterium]|nr:winged helix-turn-helix domain-containing protein [Bryobacteraceae bacterium]
MLPQSQPPARLAFGPFEVDVGAQQLLKGGIRLRLSSQPFRILLILLSHPGNVIASEQLRCEIWDDATFVDFDHGIHAAVNKLRRALGDSAENPRYIETVPGRGYRFIGTVQHRLIAPSPATTGATPTLVPPQVIEEPPAVKGTSNSRRRIAAVAMAGPVALAVWLVFQFFRQAPSDERVFSLQIDPPENGAFSFGTGNAGIALSPDGKFAAYVATVKGDTAMWLRPLDRTFARRLPGTEGAGLPFWSPDSKSIAFFAEGKLERVDLVGGPPQTICEVGLSPGGSWGSDGQIVVAGWGAGLFQVPATGGKLAVLTVPDASRQEIFHYWPQILPGGRVLYFVRSRKREDTGVYAASFAKPREQVQILATDTNAFYAPARNANDHKGYLLWLRGPALVAQDFDTDSLKLSGVLHTIADPVARMPVHGQMLASLSANGTLLYSASAPLRQLTWVDRAGKTQGPLGEPALSAHFRLSPDGRRVAVTRVNSGGSDLWMLDTARGVWSRFTYRPGISLYPVWSPDGRSIVFARDAPFNLFRQDANGFGTEQRLTQSPDPQFPMDWSPDGRFILYEQDDAAGDRRSLWVLPTNAGAQPWPYLRTPFNEDMGRFSPDGRWMAFQSDESGRNEVYIAEFPEPRGKVQISTAGGVLPQWGAGAHELFYVSPDFNLMSAKLNLGARSVEPSAPRALFRLPTCDPDLSPYQAAPDGRRLLILANPERADPLTLIVNWPALLHTTATAQ